MNKLVGVSRPMVLGVLESFIAAAWNDYGPDFHRIVVREIGVPGGFRSPYSKPWAEARGAVRKALKGSTARPLTVVAKACFTQTRHADLARFYRLLGIGTPKQSDDDVLEQTSVPPADSDYARCWSSIPESERATLALCITVIADDGIEEWRSSAARTFEALVLPWAMETGDSKSPPPPDQRELAAREQGSACHGEQPIAELVAATPGILPQAEDASCAPAATDTPDQPAARALIKVEPTRLTLLDVVLIDLVLQSVAGQHGARSLEEMADVVREVVGLNTKRRQSKFHQGFLAALTGASLPERSGEDNDSRRAWLLSGWLMGHHRRDMTSSIARFEQLSERDQRALLEERDAVEGAANEFVARCVELEDHHGIQVWIGHAGIQGMLALLAYVSQLLGRGDASRALEMSSLLLEACHRRGIEPMLKQTFEEAILPLRAQALRHLRQYAAAEECLDRWDTITAAVSAVDRAVIERKDAPNVIQLSPNVSNDVSHERLLCAIRVGDLEELWLASGSSVSALRHRFHGVSSRLQDCVRGAGPRPSIALAYLFAMGCVLCGPSLHNGDLPEPQDLIAAALLHNPPSPQGERSILRERLELLRALFVVGEGGAVTGNAIAIIVEYERSNGRLPFEFIGSAIESALILDDERVKELVLPRLASDFEELQRRGLVEACLRNTGVVRGVIEARDGVGENLSHAELVSVSSGVLAAACDLRLPRRQLVELADELIMRVSEFADGAEEALRVMLERNRWSFIWDEEQFSAIRAGLASWCREETRVVQSDYLLRRAQAMARDEPETATELLEYCEVLGVPHDDIRACRARIKRLSAETMSTVKANPEAMPPVRVLFVGGDARQAKAQHAIERQVVDARPNTVVEFMYPGWGSNWKDKLDRATAVVDRVDMVVMLRFMRTLFGEGLRKAVNARGKQWRPTYGHAAPSIARAIVSAANDWAAHA